MVGEKLAEQTQTGVKNPVHRDVEDAETCQKRKFHN